MAPVVLVLRAGVIRVHAEHFQYQVAAPLTNLDYKLVGDLMLRALVAFDMGPHSAFLLRGSSDSTLFASRCRLLAGVSAFHSSSCSMVAFCGVDLARGCYTLLCQAGIAMPRTLSLPAGGSG